MRLFLVLGLLPALGCASLPPTKVPACDGTFQALCHAPVEMDRSLAWEAVNACPSPSNPDRRFPRGTPRGVPADWCACYAFAGVEDYRQVYRYVLRSCR